MGLDLKDLKLEAYKKKGKQPSKAIEYKPLEKRKTFTAYLNKDIKILSEIQPQAIGVVSYAVNKKKGDKVSVTEFYDGQTFYVIDGDKWYANELKKKRELKEVQEGKKDPSKNALNSSLFFFYNYGLGKNPSKEEIQKKIDEPIKRPFPMGMGSSFSGRSSAILIKKDDFSLDKETAMKTKLSPKGKKKYLIYGLIAVLGYFAYKKFKK